MIYHDIGDQAYIGHAESSQQEVNAKDFFGSKFYVVLGEFSETVGPVALKILPDDDKAVCADINNFLVQILAVDYTGTHAGVPSYSPEDTVMLYKQPKSRKLAYVHFFNLHDIKARGYCRVFILAFITLSNEYIFKNIQTIRKTFEAIANVCHKENVIKFHEEMCERRKQFVNDVIESDQITWWLKEIEKQHALPMPKDPGQEVKMCCDDLHLLNYFSVSSPNNLGRIKRSKSLPNSGFSITRYPHMEGCQTMRELVPIAYRYMRRCMHNLYRSGGKRGINGLGGDGLPRHPRLCIGKYVLQCPQPTFYLQSDEVSENLSQGLGEQLSGSGSTSTKFGSAMSVITSSQENSPSNHHTGSSSFYLPQYSLSLPIADSVSVGDSTFFPGNGQCFVGRPSEALIPEQEYFSSGSETESYEISAARLKCKLDATDPMFISSFQRDTRLHPSSRERRDTVDTISMKSFDRTRPGNDPERQILAYSAEQLTKRWEQVNCINPANIEGDIMILLGKTLKNVYKDSIYALLSGRCLVLVGQDKTSSAIMNALSLFVTCPQRIATEIQTKLTLTDLSKYALIHCSRSASKTVESFAKGRLCSVINIEKRTAIIPRYTGDLIPRIWSVDWSKFPGKPSGSLVFSALQCGLVSELGDEVMKRYYSILLDKECALEGEFQGSCDDLIIKGQIHLLLDKGASFLTVTHEPSFEFRF